MARKNSTNKNIGDGGRPRVDKKGLKRNWGMYCPKKGTVQIAKVAGEKGKGNQGLEGGPLGGSGAICFLIGSTEILATRWGTKRSI